jgi:tyrosine-protein phosphatase non-receptor type 13 protein
LPFFKEHGHREYFLLEHYIPESLIIQCEDEPTLKKRMQLLHKGRQGLDPGKAEEIYITIVQTLKGYGSHFYNAVWVRAMFKPAIPCSIRAELTSLAFK